MDNESETSTRSTLAWSLAGIGMEPAVQPVDVYVFGVVILATVPLLCWIVWLMYRSYAVSFNVRGGKAIGTFIAALIIAEAVSKAIIIMALRAVMLS